MDFVRKLSPDGNSLQWSAWLLLALLLLALPLRWLAAAAVSILVHELCHWAAVVLCGERVTGICLTPGGVVLYTGPLTPGKQMLCALAGPVGGLVLFAFCRQMPRLALCALLHSFWNLLPIYPLDGGRALQSFLYMVIPNHVRQVFRVLQNGAAAILTAACFWATFARGLGLLPLVMAAWLLVKMRSEPPRERHMIRFRK